MRPLLPLAVLVLLAGCASPPGPTEVREADPGQQCPAPHVHATFAVFVPGAGGAPRKVDFASPKTPAGKPYYDYASAASGGARNMTRAVHMHQTGAETGSAALGPTQLHMEEDGVCVSVTQALHAVEVSVGPSTLRLWGAHAQPGQEGSWSASGARTLRFWIEAHGPSGWAWGERAWDDIAGHQLQDGEALLVAFGDHTAAQIQSMQAQVPEPSTRAG